MRSPSPASPDERCPGIASPDTDLAPTDALPLVWAAVAINLAGGFADIYKDLSHHHARCLTPRQEASQREPLMSPQTGEAARYSGQIGSSDAAQGVRRRWRHRGPLGPANRTFPLARQIKFFVA